MTNQAKVRREQVIMGVLLLVFGLILARSLKQLGFFGRPEVNAQKAAAASTPAAPNSLTEVAHNYRGRFEAKVKKMTESQAVSPTPGAANQGPAYTAQNLRDPLVSLLPKPKLPEQKPKPAVGEAEKAPLKLPELVVNGLVWGGSNPQAVINGKLYSVGEAVEGATLTAIAADGVTLEFQGQMFQISSNFQNNLSII
jgi:hypothetical protein